MEKNLYIDASHPDETRVVLKSESHIEEYEYENKNRLYLKNNIYLGKVSRIEPSLQAAFVNYGKERHGFLAFNDIQSDYYQIPHDDKDKLKNQNENINNLKGLKILLIYKWKIGDILVWDRCHLHCSSANIKDKKLGLTSFYKK